MRTVITVIGFAFLVSACSSGLGKGVRADVTSTMQSSDGDLTKCYADALAKDPKATGELRLALRVVAKSGEFKPTVESNSLNDPAFEECVLGVVSSLKLSKPQKAHLTTTYPLEFVPN